MGFAKVKLFVILNVRMREEKKKKPKRPEHKENKTNQLVLSFLSSQIVITVKRHAIDV